MKSQNLSSKSQTAKKLWSRGTVWNLSLGICLGFGIGDLGFQTATAQDKVTYQDHILPFIEANCSKCHNSDKKKADLDLTSYQGALKGSGSGVVLLSGNQEGTNF